MKETAPRKPSIATAAKDVTFGDAADEESDPIDDRISELLNGARCEA